MHIVIEGQDGTGKDTQAQLLVEYLRSQGKTVHFYAESGTASENPFLAKIAELNYGSDQNIDAKTHALLYLVNRYQQWHDVAEPALKKNEIVITTRNWLSTLIYMGYVNGVSKSAIIKMHKSILPDRYFKPDCIVILTLTEEERAARRIAQGERTTKEIWKSKPSEFQQKVNNSYLRVAKEYNIPTLSAAGTPEEVFERLKKLFEL